MSSVAGISKILWTSVVASAIRTYVSMLHISPGFQGLSQNPDRTGSDRIDKTQTGSERINKTCIGLRPIDKKRKGFEQNRIATMIPLKWLRDSSIEMAEEEVCRCDLAQTSSVECTWGQNPAFQKLEEKLWLANHQRTEVIVPLSKRSWGGTHDKPKSVCVGG